MINFFLVSIMSIITVYKTGAQTNADLITGRWLSMDNKVEVEIYKNGNEYNGKIVWLDDSNDRSRPMNTRTDKNNPSSVLRTQRLIGLVVLIGLVYNKEQNKWEGGRIYNPESGRELDAKAWLKEDGNLNVRGYVGFELLGKDLLFKKVL